MTVLLLVGFFAAILYRLKAPWFESVFTVLLLTPVLFFLIGRCWMAAVGAAPSDTVYLMMYIVSAALLIASAYFVCGVTERKFELRELESFGIFAALFTVAYVLCRLWPDFIAMGERLRDYSLLATSVRSPIVPQEPWMSGSVLNYYVYWYRFGHFLHSAAGLQIWSIYHSMAAFAVAFYGVCLYKICRTLFRGSFGFAAVIAFVTVFGPNISGVRLWWTNDSGWWGPSRVIKGAINEFPAWSFLLGDLHPHFLNLGLILFSVIILSTLTTVPARIGVRIGIGAAWTFTAVLWLLSSNAWEVPMWAGVVAVLSTLAAALWWDEISAEISELTRGKDLFLLSKQIASAGILVAALLGVLLKSSSLSLAAEIFLITGALGFAYFFFPNPGSSVGVFKHLVGKPRMLTAGILWMVILIALKLSSSHIVAEGGALSIVRDPIPSTRTVELFAHWGFQLSLCALFSLALIPGLAAKILCSVFLAGTLAFDEGALFLYVLGGVQIVRIMLSFRRDQKLDSSSLWGDTLLLAGLGLILLPEFVFLDDPYGGENERMNTIFKTYTTAWGLLSLGAASLAIRLFTLEQAVTASGRSWVLITRFTFGIVLSFLTVMFMYHVGKIRRSATNVAIVEPFVEGLSEVERRFPGSSDAIRAIRAMPEGVVLEAQGNAYDYTGFVSTLSGMPAFLGWSNHINLLTRQYGEVTRREKVTASFYTESSCSNRLETARKENVRYIVVGTLEKKKHPESATLDFSCFTEILKKSDYSVYSLPAPS